MASNGLEELPPALLEFLHLLRHDFLMSTLLESMMNGMEIAAQIAARDFIQAVFYPQESIPPSLL